MSFYDWACVCAGFVEFNSPPDDEKAQNLSGDETSQLARLIEQPPLWLN